MMKGGKPAPAIFFNVYKQENVSENGPTHTWKNFNNMIEKAKVIQNLLDISNGDGRVMAQYVEQPDLDHWFYSDLTTKQKKLARELWNIH